MLGCVPLGDQAILVSFAEEHEAFAFAERVRRELPAWLDDVVQAYKTVALFYELMRISHAEATSWAQRFDATPLAAAPPAPLHRIPCCYEFGPDLERVAAHCGLTPDRVVALHASVEYVVYAIGFCPGFPYLGYLPADLAGVPRLATPRLRVEAGSVGLTGRQTGIYTEERPGGWSLIGRTPLTLVDVAGGYFPLRTGHGVRFEPISRAEFTARSKERLA